MSQENASPEGAPKQHLYELWLFFVNSHGLTLLDSELIDVIRAVHAFAPDELASIDAQKTHPKT